MEPIIDLSAKHGFSIVEDACHAIGATYKKRMAGSFGNLGCFSFHEQKNMSTLGEGGMVVTDDPKLYERVTLSVSLYTCTWAQYKILSIG